MSTRTVFVDVETTGVQVGYHEAWEIALVVRDGAETREHTIYVEPERLANADSAALRVNRFYERTANLGRPVVGVPATPGPRWATREQAAALIARETANATLVGLNVQFDERFMHVLVRSGGYQVAWDYHLIDVRSLAIGYLAGQGREIDVDPVPQSYALSSLCGVGAPHADKAHTALADARWARDWHDAIRGGAR